MSLLLAMRAALSTATQTSFASGDPGETHAITKKTIAGTISVINR